MSSLTGSTISSTYQSLLKIDGNNTISATLRNITDGVGNITPISMSTTLLNISTAFKLSSYGTGARTGTATYNLAVDATGNVIEVLGGGGGQNPTALFMPVNNGTSNFVDSNIENDVNNILATRDTGGYFGFNINFSNKYIYLGDFNSTNNGTFIVVDDNNQYFQTINQGNDLGLFLDFFKRTYYLGDFSGYNNGTTLQISEDVDKIITKNNNGDQGISLNFANRIYSLGDYNSVTNNTYVEVDDDNEKIKFKANTKLVFQGANLLDANTYTYSDKNLVIEAPDGNTYYIPLYS
jgi:hypothetical protein